MQLNEQLVNVTHNDKSLMLTSLYLLEIATKASFDVIAESSQNQSRLALADKLGTASLDFEITSFDLDVHRLSAQFILHPNCRQNNASNDEKTAWAFI